MYMRCPHHLTRLSAEFADLIRHIIKGCIPKKINTLNGHRNADKRANSFWQFLHFFPTEFLVFLLCRQTDKEFRLPWPSFARVEIYYRYRLSINRKYILPKSWIYHSEVVRASASRFKGHEFESRTIHFNYQGFFFISLSFFFFSISK